MPVSNVDMKSRINATGMVRIHRSRHDLRWEVHSAGGVSRARQFARTKGVTNQESAVDGRGLAVNIQVIRFVHPLLKIY